MRFLKTKIQKAQEALQRQLAVSEALSQNLKNQKEILLFNENVRLSNERVEGLRSFKSKLKTKEEECVSSPQKTDEYGRTKNIVVNYASTIKIFAASPLAIPYLQTRLESETITHEDFIAWIKNDKSKIGGICSFRARLLVEEEDDAKTAACKRVFQWIAEIFIKYFSVNWIMNGRMAHKDIYLKFRFKMLRRVRNPEAFTYIKHRIYQKKKIR